jgi:hypothetical protein
MLAPTVTVTDNGSRGSSLPSMPVDYHPKWSIDSEMLLRVVCAGQTTVFCAVRSARLHAVSPHTGGEDLRVPDRGSGCDQTRR